MKKVGWIIFEAPLPGGSGVPTGGQGWQTLISLTRLNGTRFVMNAQLIQTIEERPDTTIVLVNGETFIVKERMQEVVAKAVEYGRMARVLGL